ncbi:MAG TPA: hypothetical protein DCK95_05970 [Anaerolineaceae bacterium]|nr:hypothetical protein [Anaerolineaceae bacterium]
MRNRVSILSIIMLGFLMSACEMTFPASYRSGEIIMADDFSSPNFQWDVWKREDNSTVAYYDDGLVFVINSPNTDYVSTVNSFYENTRMEVFAANLNGLMNNGFGLVCRYQDDENYYAFLVSSDGYFGILRVLYGGFTVLNSGKMQYSDIIRQGESINHIRADCVGNQLTLYVNNNLLAQVEDDVFSEGLLGLTASSFEEPGVAILFDNFLVMNP